MGEGCASGARDRVGRLCPEVESRPRTPEGLALWQVLQRPAAWVPVGAGLGAVMMLDRTAIERRLDPPLPLAILDDLLDPYEASARAAMARAEEFERKRKADRERGRDGEDDHAS